MKSNLLDVKFKIYYEKHVSILEQVKLMHSKTNPIQVEVGPAL